MARMKKKAKKLQRGATKTVKGKTYKLSKTSRWERVKGGLGIGKRENIKKSIKARKHKGAGAAWGYGFGRTSAVMVPGLAISGAGGALFKRGKIKAGVATLAVGGATAVGLSVGQIRRNYVAGREAGLTKGGSALMIATGVMTAGIPQAIMESKVAKGQRHTGFLSESRKRSKRKRKKK